LWMRSTVFQPDSPSCVAAVGIKEALSNASPPDTAITDQH
jgi:hypothetical protein